MMSATASARHGRYNPAAAAAAAAMLVGVIGYIYIYIIAGWLASRQTREYYGRSLARN
jgi:hypothetical protein